MRHFPMAGNHRSGGQNRKSIADHTAAGTYRRDRHGKAAEAEEVESADHEYVVKFGNLSPEGSKFFDIIAAELGAKLRTSDSAMCSILCELWSLTALSFNQAYQKPNDK